MEKEFLMASDGYKLSLAHYKNDKPKAIIQIAHGMEEHKERYDDFCKFLNSNGFAVIIADMRGHGEDTPSLGFFKEKKGYERLVLDQYEIRKHISEMYKDLPCYLFAHSMGTIISRVVLQKYSNCYDKVVLCGYPNYQKGAPVGLALARMISFFKGPKSKSNLLRELSTGSFGKNIDKSDGSDWISYNPENVKVFNEDPLCGFGFTSSAYADLVKLVCLMHKPKLYKDVNLDLKMLLIRGEDDPCVGGKKGEEDSYNVLLKAGFKNIEKINYPHMRHEILNEKDYQKVYNDVLNFFVK